MPRRIESFFVAGPAGRIECLLEEPENQAPVHAAVICHPHPLYGGTMHNKVVYRLARAFRRAGAVVLRFNFRGVNLSEGEHDQGVGEVEDAFAVLTELRERYPAVPYSLAGFSFGSRVALLLGCRQTSDGPQRIVAAGFPTRIGDFGYLTECNLPKFFVSSTHDEFGPKADLERLYATFAEPKSLEFIEARDHFFDGALPEFEEAVVRIAGRS